MSLAVCGLAILSCSFGSAPSTLNIMPNNNCVSKMPIANIMDNKPAINISSFGNCTALQGASCTPITAAPWVAGAANVLIKNFPALTKDSLLFCSMQGIISITDPGQNNIML